MEGQSEGAIAGGRHCWSNHVCGRSQLWGPIRPCGSVECIEGLDREELEDLKDLKQIQCTVNAFAGLKKDGSIMTWGTQLFLRPEEKEALKQNFTEIQAASHSFCALRADGSMFQWGDLKRLPELDRKVKKIQANQRAFAAILEDDSVVAWGPHFQGGELPEKHAELMKRQGVVAIQGNEGAFAAVLKGGDVITWGDPECGGEEEDKDPVLIPGPAVGVAASRGAFAVLRKDGTVQCKGLACGAVAANDKGVKSGKEKSDDDKIEKNKDYKGKCGKDDKAKGPVCMGKESVFTLNMAEACPSVVAEKLQATDEAFAALTPEGSVVCWGIDAYGGTCTEQLKDVKALQATSAAFAALRADGTVFTWGRASHGGDSSKAVEQLRDVKEIQANSTAFAALRLDATVVAWGDPRNGGDCSEVDLKDVKAIHIQASQHGFSALVGEKLVSWGAVLGEAELPAVQEGGESEELEDDKLVKPPRATKGDVFKEGKKMFEPFEKCAQEPKKRLRLRSPRNRAGG